MEYPQHRLPQRKVYDFLEAGRGFAWFEIRTDYCFDTMEQIQQVVTSLFGQEMLERLIDTCKGRVLSECTGLSWREFRTKYQFSS